MVYNVQDFGAKRDNRTLDHEAIQAAIDRCAAEGGGTVHVPAGNYRCGTIRLKSNINLHLETGAEILGADDPSLYPVIAPTPYGNLPGQIQALIWADAVENASITGQGAIVGNGSKSLSIKEAVDVKFRPALVFCRNSRRIKFIDVTLRHSSFWTLHLLRCEDVAIRGISILANKERINTDGIDPDGCRNVIISDCHIVAGDDCIVIKSTEGDPCENITVTNCVLSSAHAALKLGTESLADIRNIVFSNCVIHKTNVGLALYMKDGGTYENIVFSNLVIEAENEFPVLVDITPRYYKEPRVGRIRNVYLDNLIVTGKGRCLVEGAETQPVENLTLSNITWNITGTCDPANEWKPSGGKRVELDPDRTNYAIQPFHFVIINACRLRMNNIQLCDQRTDPSPDRGLVYLEGVNRGFIENVYYDNLLKNLPDVSKQDCFDIVTK
ncbi:MAG: glycoside hydrolase family 28 protein [Bacteroidota bacterium]